MCREIKQFTNLHSGRYRKLEKGDRITVTDGRRQRNPAEADGKIESLPGVCITTEHISKAT